MRVKQTGREFTFFIRWNSPSMLGLALWISVRTGLGLGLGLELRNRCLRTGRSPWSRGRLDLFEWLPSLFLKGRRLRITLDHMK